jgi:4'-phosphopantetheinyl transferase
VHVWRAELTSTADRLTELLSEQERARAERFAHEHDRLRWSRAHGVLRALLGRYVRRDPRELRFTAGRHGKPSLAERPVSCFFNLSHSGDQAVYAFSCTTAVGVDIEIARGARDEVALAARVFGEAQARRLAALAPAAREREFLRSWVKYEAALKCQGVGLGGSDAQPAKEHELWIAELDGGPRGAAAVAAEQPPRELHCWDWRP